MRVVPSGSASEYEPESRTAAFVVPQQIHRWRAHQHKIDIDVIYFVFRRFCDLDSTASYSRLAFIANHTHVCESFEKYLEYSFQYLKKNYFKI